MDAGLQNDYKVIMKDIEDGLHAVHASARQTNTVQTGINHLELDVAEQEKKAIVRVDRVDEDSPASSAVSAEMISKYISNFIPKCDYHHMKCCVMVLKVHIVILVFNQSTLL